MRDIVSHLGTRDFHRLRIGIGHPGSASKVIGYVLARPSVADRIAIDKAFADTLTVVPEILAGKFQLAMNVLHTRS